MFSYCFLFTDQFAVLPRLLFMLGPSGLQALFVSHVYLHLGLQNLQTAGKTQQLAVKTSMLAALIKINANNHIVSCLYLV